MVFVYKCINNWIYLRREAVWFRNTLKPVAWFEKQQILNNVVHLLCKMFLCMSCDCLGVVKYNFSESTFASYYCSEKYIFCKIFFCVFKWSFCFGDNLILVSKDYCKFDIVWQQQEVRALEMISFNFHNDKDYGNQPFFPVWTERGHVWQT